MTNIISQQSADSYHIIITLVFIGSRNNITRKISTVISVIFDHNLMWVIAIALCNYFIDCEWLCILLAYHCCCCSYCFELDFFSIHLIPWHLFVWKDEDQKDISWLAENKSWNVQSIKSLLSVSSQSLARKLWKLEIVNQEKYKLQKYLP